MVDKIINPAMVANAYSATSKGVDVSKGIGMPQKESFGSVLKNAAIQSINTLRAGEAASARAVSGDASLPEVVQAITASEVTLQTVMAVRDRLVGAYQEIMRMPV
jgi:flagellar hook-basal body complex protein FliE